MTGGERQRVADIERAIRRHGDFSALRDGGERLVQRRAAELGLTSTRLLASWTPPSACRLREQMLAADQAQQARRTKRTVDADDADEADDEAEQCMCPCAACEDGRCEDCSDPSCDDPNCQHDGDDDEDDDGDDDEDSPRRREYEEDADDDL